MILEEMTEHDLTLIGRKANSCSETTVRDAKTVTTCCTTRASR